MLEATPAALPILHERYRIEERLGTGRLAVVYRAYDMRLQRAVLVHLLRRELGEQQALRQRFLEEAQNSARRSHRSLLDVYDSGELAGRPYIVTEFVSGRSLREIGALTPEHALLYFRQLVGAVAACQAAGVPHPPISSANVLLVDDGRVELLENWKQPFAEVAQDLVAYRPPERSTGAAPNAAGTVYSLGLLLIEMLTGQRVVQGQDAASLVEAARNPHIPTISHLLPRIYAPSLDDLIRRMTALDISKRPQDAISLTHMLDGLRRDLLGETQRLPAAPPQPSVGERVRRSTTQIRRPMLRKQPNQGQPAASQGQRQPAQQAAASVDNATMTKPPSLRAIIGLIIMLSLFVVVGFTAYYLTSLAAENLTQLRIPRPEITLPTPNINLPEWLTGVVEGEGEILEVTISDPDGLNLRDAPGLNSQVIRTLPNGLQVRKIADAREVDGVNWIPVRVRIDGIEVEGWVSALFVRQL